ncbi:MAG: pyrroline-5-carboxylate reductase [Notoacmeibacter sp.]|nr:pyrroline-5-carboxylate reductase [Notoacmeibacter sp.]
MKIIMAGCGNMGYAMLSAWLDSGQVDPDDCHVVEPNEALRQRVATRGVHAHAGAGDIPEGLPADLVVLAVKPQVMGDVVPQYRRFAETGATFLSIAAGTKIAFLTAMLGSHTPIVRCMPNTPAAIGRGMMVTVSNEHVSTAMSKAIEALLSANGAVDTVGDEALMDPVTAVSGSGPAYVFHFIECLTAAAEAAGLSPETASLLAKQTVLGAAELAASSSETPARLREQVTSPNGTTAAALAVLMGDNRLANLVAEAVEAARRRSVELGA